MRMLQKMFYDAVELNESNTDLTRIYNRNARRNRAVSPEYKYYFFLTVQSLTKHCKVSRSFVM